MMKISALNEESHEESEEENTSSITKEAQEQLALTEYNKALHLLKENQLNDALNILKDLVETELLDQVEKPLVPDGRTRPMLSLKYCCYKNIASIYRKMDNYEAAIDNYWEAANLDDSDVMLWYTMGVLSTEILNLEFASSAFKQALNCNSNHWPSLDNIITVMYAIPDYMNCLLYISIALERDPTYIKGLIFREKIFKKIPYFEESYKLFNVDWTLDPPLMTDFDRILGNELLAEAQEMADKWIDICKSEFVHKSLPDLTVNVPLKNYTWLELGESLINMYEYIMINNFNFVSKIRLEMDKTDDKKLNPAPLDKEIKVEGTPEITIIDMDKNEENDEMIESIDAETENVIDVNTKNLTEEIENNHINNSNDLSKNDQSCLEQIEANNKSNSTNQMDIDVNNEDDNESNSSEVHIIEIEDPLKIDSFELEEFDQAVNKLNENINNNTNNNISINNSNNNDSSSSCSSSNSSGSSSNSSSNSNGINNERSKLMENDSEIIKLSGDECHTFIDKMTDIIDNKVNKDDETFEKFKAETSVDDDEENDDDDDNNNNDEDDKGNDGDDDDDDDDVDEDDDDDDINNDDILKISDTDNDNIENNQSQNILIDNSVNNVTTTTAITAAATTITTIKITDNTIKVHKDGQQKVKKRRRSSLCFLQQWAWSSSSMRRSARVRGSNKREIEREDIQLEEIMRRLFPQNLLPDTAKIIKDDPSKNADDSMDTMDLYQLFANQENSHTDINPSNDSNINGNNGNNDDSSNNNNCNNDFKNNETTNKNNGIKDNHNENEATKNVDGQHKTQYFGTDREKKQVMSFINEHSGKSNIMVIIGKMTELLSTKWNHDWPNKLTDVYQKLYVFTRKHIPHNNDILFCNINGADSHKEDAILTYDAEMTLLFIELYTDKWLDSKSDILVNSTIDKFGIGLPTEELGYIIFSSVYYDDENLSNSTDNLLYLLRVLWVKVNIFLCQGEIKMVIKTLNLLIDFIEKYQDESSHELSIKLLHCKYNSQITLPIVKKRLMSIERSEKLGQVEKLYEEKKFYELSLILKDTFKFSKSTNKQQYDNEMQTALFLNNMKLNNIDRTKQFAMLLESLWQLEQYEECYSWCEICLYESWQYYSNNSLCNMSDKKKWSSCTLNCLEKLELCVEMAGTSVSRYLPDSRISRLVQTLIQIICHQLDVPENTIEMPLETVTPWILLHHILQYQDDKERAVSSRNAQKYKNKKTLLKKIKQKPSLSSTTIYNENSNENIENGVAYDSDLDSSSTTVESNTDKDNNDIPSPMMILFIGHDFLGRHSWCCIDEAKLLLFTIKTVIPYMHSTRYTSVREKITKHLEQIFWCLYGHPNRTNKTRPKHLEEHGVPQIPLTWDIAQLLFEYYKPDILPEFDTPKPMSITADIKILFKKINTLVPPEHDPSGMIEQITGHIIGDIEEAPTVAKPLPYQVETLYYLLGDYSFKNNNWSSATKYYTMDVCLHPNAVNSWAALAMSVSTLIGSSLNNCKPITDAMKLLYQAKVAQCCYQRAVELKPGHSVIWIEYGNFVYMIHSFCSRLLKQESDTLSMEKFSILETRKEQTLEIAANCFVSANRIYLANIDDTPDMLDERWLFYYMLAKIAEKKNSNPTVFLQHYATASELLHKNNAHYPKKISHKNAHYLSIEALEVHYRIHASILKYFEQHDGKPLKKSLALLFLKYLLDCANGPFMQFQSKLSKNKYYRDEITSEVGSIATTKTYQDKFLFNNENFKNQFNDNNTSKTLTTLDDKIQQSQNQILADDVIVIASSNDNNKNTDLNKSKSDNINNNKKRTRPSNENSIDDCSKRIKLSNVSHIEVMQDVLGFIDDLISNVCKMVNSKQNDEEQKNNETCMIISSDENEEYNEYHNKAVPGNKDEQLLLDDHEIQFISDNQKILNSNQDVHVIDEQVDKSAAYSTNNKDKHVKDDKYVFDKKKTQVNTVKDDATMSRRGSQESTTTTLTTTTNDTNNSSFSSSDESSSSEDSSDSDSSTADSDSESGESDNDKKKINNQANEKEKVDEEEEEYTTEEEVSRLISYCLAGLEQCVLRFPEHYKSIYRLCHFYFNHKSSKDNAKCRDLLLGTYKCQYYTGLSFQGLFADRKSTNFFNGVWRIPVEEIDRPGSFASHMSRCITLLLQVLKETEDSRTLMELCIQLRKTPDPDKKYVRDSEREQLSRQAYSLCLQSLRTRVQTMGLPNSDDNITLARNDPRTRILLDVYKIYQQVQKNFQGKEVQAFATLLVDTYKVYINFKSSEGNILENAVRFCQQQNLANKIAASQSNFHHNQHLQTSLSSNLSAPSMNIPINSSVITTATTAHTFTSINTISATDITIATPAPTIATNIINTSTINTPLMQSQSYLSLPQASYYRKTSYKPSGTGRPRGRPPNTNKYMQNYQQQSGITNNLNQFGAAKTNFANSYLGTSGNQPLLNPYFINPLIDQNMISTLFTAGLASNMLDSLSTANYLKSLGNYHDFVRQYQNNLSSISNSLTSTFNNSTMSLSNTTMGDNIISSNITSAMEKIGSMTTQPSLNLNAPSTTTGVITNAASTSKNITNSVPTAVSNTNTGTTNMSTSIAALSGINTTSATTITTASRASNIHASNIHPSGSIISHNISITPVSTINSQSKSLKSLKHDMLNLPTDTMSGVKAIHHLKAVPQSGMAQVSLLKPSVLQSNKVPTKPMLQMAGGSGTGTVATPTITTSTSSEFTGQIRVAKNLIEPIHSSSSRLSCSKNSSPSSITANILSSIPTGLQNPEINIKPVPAGIPRMSNAGTSLQHKLQLKKQSQQMQPSQQSIRKQKVTNNKSLNSHSSLTNTYQSNLPNINTSSRTIMSATFPSNDLSEISISPVNNLDSSENSLLKYHHNHHQHYPNLKKSTAKFNKPTLPTEITDSMQSCLPPHASSVISNATTETLNMLSQLQQHSHLEIIPQSKHLNTKVMSEYSKNKSHSLNAVPQKPISSSSDSMSKVIESLLSTNSSKKPDKNIKDSVEIITLDD